MPNILIFKFVGIAQVMTRNPTDAVDTMRMIQKGQWRYAGKEVYAQNNKKVHNDYTKVLAV